MPSLKPGGPDRRAWVGFRKWKVFCLVFFALATFPGCHSPLRSDFKSSSLSQPPPAPRAESPAWNMPYRVAGRTYYPVEDIEGYVEEGIASWYGPKFHGKATSNREVYNMHSLTAAHKTLPFNTRVRVTNLENGRSLVVRINDRGPFVGNRIIDLSYRAGRRLGMVENGTVRVRLEVVSQPAGWTQETPAIPQAYTVQVGMFRNRDNARRLARELGDGRIQPFRKRGQTLYRVLTTAYNTFDRAQERMDALRREGRTGAFVIPEP